MQFKFEREVDNDFVHAIFVTMCEPGAIEYWANPDLDRHDEFKTFDGEHIIEVRISIDDEPVPGFNRQQTIDGSIVHAGIERLLTGAVEIDADRLGRLLRAILDNDASEVDGDLVDSIVQAGLFNDHVFG
ncbi:hypothetical protein ACODYM_29035 [Burkholderia gladioli]|uniref:hypothetical protein n=1 Tax=Burkholderia gladioli TaxID=28095 RepID=UPI003B503F29